MAMACGSRLATSLLQENSSSLVSSGAGRTDVWRMSSSSQLRQGFRRTCRLPALSVTEENRSSFPLNLTCHARGSKVQHVNAVVDALNQTRAAKRYEPIFTIKIHEVGKIKFGAGKAARLAFCYEIGKDHSLFGHDLDTLEGIDWDNFGFGLRPTDFMYVMKGDLEGNWQKGELQPFGNLEVSPAAGVLNYGQGVFEGMKAYRTDDDRILMFRPEENALRMTQGAERMSMPTPDVDTFVSAVKQTVLANKRWVPPAGKGSLYIRPLLIGTGPILGLAPAPEYTFLIYVSPVGAYFKGGLSPIDLKVETYFHRAAPGGTGGVKTISNYAPVLKTQLTAKGKGYSDVLYLDAVENKYVEEVSSCNIFIVKNKVISTPELAGTILPGITRKSIIQLARSRGYEVNERPVAVDELLDADEVFCTGTAVVLNPVGSITHGTSRVQYNDGSVGGVSQELYEALTSLQMGKAKDIFDWVVELA